MHFKPFVIDLLNSNNIKISDKSNKSKIIKDLICYIDALIFNIVSIGAIVSRLNNSNSIKKETIVIIKNYIEDKCRFKYKKTKGGTVLPSEFFGIESGRYQNETGVDLLNINWDKQLIRAQVGGAPLSSKEIIIKHINKILDYYGIKASNAIINELIKIFDYHIKCLIHKLKLCGEEITGKCLNNVINSNKILHVLK